MILLVIGGAALFTSNAGKGYLTHLGLGGITSTLPEGGPLPGGDPLAGTQTASGASNGTQLGNYTFVLPGQATAPLGVTQPTRAQLNPADGADIAFNGESSLQPESNDQMLDLGGQPPSYQSCAADTVIEPSATAAQGTTFCVAEPGQRIAGVTVDSIGSTETNASYVTLSVTVWQSARS